MKEIVEFISPKASLHEQELQGRHSGSLAWRQLRGETGVTPANEVRNIFKRFYELRRYFHSVNF